MGSTGATKANCGRGREGSKAGDEAHSATDEGTRGKQRQKKKKSEIFHTMQTEMTCSGKKGVKMEQEHWVVQVRPVGSPPPASSWVHLWISKSNRTNAQFSWGGLQATTG